MKMLQIWYVGLLHFLLPVDATVHGNVDFIGMFLKF